MRRNSNRSDESPLLGRLPMVWPTALNLSSSGPAKTWIQVAKTGEFFSSRYGKFAITRDDLRTMLSNFQTITPIAPTQLPVDYDHLAMNPKNPGDGRAAGWFTGPMELRDGGNTLWAEVEFTPAAAEHLRNKEYRFISPSFVRNYVWKDGKNIGTTLIAAAITNMPFLEGMQAVTLSNAMGDVAVTLASGAPMEAGQVVSLKAEVDEAKSGQAFVIEEVAGNGPDAFAKLKDAEGVVLPGWYRIDELEPAPAPTPVDPATAQPTPAAPVAANLSEVQMPDVFTLRDARGASTDVKSEDVQKFIDDQIAAAKAAAVPEGHQVISASVIGEFEATKQTVVALRNEVNTLRDQNEQQEKAAHLAAITRQLDTLSTEGRITKPERDWALKTYSEPVSLSAFTEYFEVIKARPALVNVTSLSGSGAGVEAPTSGKANNELHALAIARQAEKKISYGDALSQVSQERTDLSTQYREEAVDVRHMRARH